MQVRKVQVGVSTCVYFINSHSCPVFIRYTVSKATSELAGPLAIFFMRAVLLFNDMLLNELWYFQLNVTVPAYLCSHSVQSVISCIQILFANHLTEPPDNCARQMGLYALGHEQFPFLLTISSFHRFDKGWSLISPRKCDLELFQFLLVCFWKLHPGLSVLEVCWKILAHDICAWLLERASIPATYPPALMLLV